MRKKINYYMPTTYMKVISLVVCTVMVYGAIETFVR
jgi:hypothetical protein